MKYFLWTAIGFVIVAIGAGLFIVGSPFQERMARFDQRRLSDLQNIQYQIANYFAAKGSLPASLADMQGFEGFSAPLDPQSRAPYEYAVKGPMQFQLCATFAMDSMDKSGDPEAIKEAISSYRGPEPQFGNWWHPAGRGCFDITLENSRPNQGREFQPAFTVKPSA